MITTGHAIQNVVKMSKSCTKLIATGIYVRPGKLIYNLSLQHDILRIYQKLDFSLFITRFLSWIMCQTRFQFINAVLLLCGIAICGSHSNFTMFSRGKIRNVWSNLFWNCLVYFTLNCTFGHTCSYIRQDEELNS